MHWAKWKAASFWLSVIGGGPVPPPNSLQAFSAATNAGPLNGMPSTVSVELPGEETIVIPVPPGPCTGSGKFGTPWERMHSDVSSWGFDAAVGGALELPQAPTTIGQINAAISAPRRRLVIFALTMVVAGPAGFSCTDGAVTAA